MVKIRKAVPEDALGIAIVNVYTWKTTYSGLIPDEVIDLRIENIAQSAVNIAENIEKNDNYIVAVLGNTVIGFCSYGRSRNEDYADYGEIYAIYILSGYQNTGIGKAIFLSGTKELKAQGYGKMIINCIQGNRSIEFYKCMGGEIISQRYDFTKDTTITEDILSFELLT